MPSLLRREAAGAPIEDQLRETARATIEPLFDEDLAAYLAGILHGRRERGLVGTFGARLPDRGACSLRAASDRTGPERMVHSP